MVCGVSRVSWVVGLAALGLAGCSDTLSGETSGRDPSAIIGGSPDMVSHGVMAIQSADGGFCSGSLIAPNLILTAQHCVANLANPEAPVECGVTSFVSVNPAEDFLVTWDGDLSNGAPQGSIYDVNLVITPSSRSLCGNDVAMLRLGSNIPASEATPIVPRVDSRPTLDEIFDAVGFGIQSPNDQTGQTAGERMRVNGLNVGCVGAGQCAGTGATGTEWAAESPICSGDSGGPALDAQGRVIGVASRGDPNCSVGIYSAVDSWRDLIVDTAIDAADDGGYEPPDWTGVEPMMDGGVPSDAGMDAGMDAGSDAGTMMDAGTPDSGMPDSGMPDSGTPDSGMPDSGTPDSGTPDAGAPDSGVDSGMLDGGPPMNDGGSPLGEPCDGSCRNGFLCYADDDEPPGICVPPCQRDDDCPNGYECSSLDVCVPAGRVDDNEDATPGESASCGCRTPGRSGSSGSPHFALFLLAVTLGTWRRRTNKSVRTPA